MHRVRDLALLFYVVACLLPALTVRNCAGEEIRTFWGYECLFIGWQALTTLPQFFPAWTANFVFFWALWSGRAGRSVQTLVLAVCACVLAFWAPLAVWLLPQPMSLGPSYYLWQGSMLLYAWKVRTAGEVVWPVV